MCTAPNDCEATYNSMRTSIKLRLSNVTVGLRVSEVPILSPGVQLLTLLGQVMLTM
jgi:hypothetical protein